MKDEAANGSAYITLQQVQTRIVEAAKACLATFKRVT